jgi:fused signal recognition particle receptor
VLDERTLEYLEESLIASDLGVETSLEIVEKVRQGAKRDDVKDLARLHSLLAEEVTKLLAEAPHAEPLPRGPVVTLVVGVNGVGKTTSIAKLARAMKERGERVLIAAGDTFRAAAIEQISLWGERLGIEVVAQKAGGDPGAVVFDALQAARARRVDQVLIDTAGRLHNKNHLMAELGKIRRIVDREAAGFQTQTILVVDATTGQNAVNQAREFAGVASVDGVFLTKLDGTAKGGMAVSMARDLKLPILYLGVGEGVDDMVDFRPREFAEALFT